MMGLFHKYFSKSLFLFILRMIVENVDKGKEVNIDQENASSVLGNPLIV